LVINLVDKDQRKLNQTQISEEIGRDLAQVPDIRYWFLKDNGQRGFALVVAGRDGPAVNRVAAEITSQAKRITGKQGEPLLTNVVSTAELDRPELRVRPKTELAADLGITTDVISEAVRIATIGDVDANLAKFNIDDRQIPIRVQLDTRARSSKETLELLKIATPSGAIVPLAQVADFQLSQGPTSIDRYDRQRRVLIGGDLAGTTPLGAAVAGVMALPAAQKDKVPEGVELKQFGDVEVMKEVFESFAKAMGLGIMLVYAVLVLLFGSFLQPITILFSLPLSIGGAIFALFVTGQAVSMPVVIGILMLMGIVTKNAIMLVDFTIEQIGKGMSRSDAIVDAGRKRARPIVMTTIAMVGGMLPAALNSGSGGEFRVPMAIAVIGGLVSSTVLSLVFVPAVYAVLDDVGKFIWWVFGRFVGATDEPGEAEQPREPLSQVQPTLTPLRPPMAAE
jgi:multidrug efflux pump subunit AcrB